MEEYLKLIPSNVSLLSAYSSITTSWGRNELYDAAQAYLSTKIVPKNHKLRVGKLEEKKNVSLSITAGGKVEDTFRGIPVIWLYVHKEKSKNSDDSPRQANNREKVSKLCRQISTYDRGSWDDVEFHHPSTFKTLALDPELKRAILDDLDRFMARKEFYKRVGKAWKRGYLLYGNWEIKLNCSYGQKWTAYITAFLSFTLSTLLNCIDGLWSSCGEARIIVFTTNHKELLDPALLRPGRMDMHIDMSYCTSQGFRVLAFNYLGIHDHELFKEIDGLMENNKVTPASLAEVLMKSGDADVALGEVLNFP
ncbi:conserved hypothetical protein [Ricinus communis]|uniref:ATPase AAA-type core domain-containing protein n=1 Tax=Ricinus communis TaxID=3988 RepID=B9RV66_RICCO|nr:conserved hypothetical protein [Ricinus communis]